MTDLQAALLERSRRNLRAARMPFAESEYDIAVSRAYYSMFYAAQAFLLSRGLEFSKHSAVIAAFGKEFSKTGDLPPVLHQYLIEGQLARTESDYEVEEAATPEAAEDQVRHAAEFLAQAKAALGEPATGERKPA